MADRGEGRDPAHAKHRSGADVPSAFIYYTISLALASGFFLAVRSVLFESAADSPQATALVGSCILLIGSVVLREYFLRGVEREARSDRHGLSEEMHPGENAALAKLSIERNRSLLGEIKRRSDAANVLSKVSAAHKEVFEACAEYLTLIESELQRMKPGSPRLEPFLKGRVRAAEAHRFHMLRWAELEATDLTLRAQGERSFDARADAVGNAIWVVDTAIEAYPAEQALIESRAVLIELKVSIDVGTLVEQADRAAENGNVGDARQILRDALFTLAQDHVDSIDRRKVADHIRQKLDELSRS